MPRTTSDIDARRFACYVTERMLEEGEVSGDDINIRLARAAFLEWSLYHLALQDDFQWLEQGEDKLSLATCPPQLIIKEWERKAYDRWKPKLAEAGSLVERGRANVVAGLQGQAGGRQGAGQRAALQQNQQNPPRLSRVSRRRLAEKP